MKDYLHGYFLPQIMRNLEQVSKGYSHCCGLCMNWDEHGDWAEYGDCKLGISKGLGFDCIIGKTCEMFNPAFEIEVGLHVHDKRIPQPIKVVE